MGTIESISIRTHARTAFVNITEEARQAVSGSGLEEGLLVAFVPHTTAGITINEQADPDVLADMRDVLDELVPWEANYRHGEGNTAAHVKASLVGASAHVMVHSKRLLLGTWQGLFLCEFDGPRTRTVHFRVLPA